MAQEYLVLKLTDGQETVSLVDNQNFALVESGWSPSIATRRTSQYSGYGPYRPVEEQISLYIFGETATETIDNLQRLVSLLDQSDAWSLGYRVRPVRLQIMVQGSELPSPLETLVLGRVSNDAPMVVTPPTFNDQLLSYQIGPVGIRFMRQALWYGEEVEGVSASQTNPSIFTVDLKEAEQVLSPTRIKVDGYEGGAAMLGSGIIAVTGVPRLSTYGINLGIFTAAGMTSAEFSPVDDSEHLAHGDNVMQIDAASNQTGTLTVLNVYADAALLSVFAAVRNNSDTAWRIRAKSSGFVTSVDRWKDVLEAEQPKIIYVGTLSNQVGAHVNVSVEVETDESTGTLDINYLAIFPHDASSQHIAVMGGDYSSAGYTRALIIDHRTLQYLTPNIWIETSETA